MKFSTVVTLAGLAVATFAAPAFADDMKGMARSPAAAKTGHATGVVTAVDSKAKTVTIKHGPIPAMGWPAMTMTFKANPPVLASAVKAGDKVSFDVKVQGSSNEVTAIRKQ
ncbi:copper-binding protein [Phenylobacterium sp. LjRoot225]|uniref:copper-binding protein n=1 Tax=Phenylobacterium sp. LjRoot225 TaxID=3342285 RepID=UPI003ED0ABB2